MSFKAIILTLKCVSVCKVSTWFGTSMYDLSGEIVSYHIT